MLEREQAEDILRAPGTLPARAVVSVIGQLSDRGWREVQSRLRVSLAV